MDLNYLDALHVDPVRRCSDKDTVRNPSQEHSKHIWRMFAGPKNGHNMPTLKMLKHFENKKGSRCVLAVGELEKALGPMHCNISAAGDGIVAHMFEHEPFFSDPSLSAAHFYFHRGSWLF